MICYAELKATRIGQHLAQHPYTMARLLSAGIEVSGPRHNYQIPFNQLLGFQCKRGIIWGEFEFELPGQKVIRLHGTEWKATQQFCNLLNERWSAWSAEMKDIAAQALQDQLDKIKKHVESNQWLTITTLETIRKEIASTLRMLPLPQERLSYFPECESKYRCCLEWQDKGEELIAAINQEWREQTLKQQKHFFDTVAGSPLNYAQALSVINGEKYVLVLASAGTGKTSVLMARVKWLSLYEKIDAAQILMLAFGRKATEEMNERLTSACSDTVVNVKTFHSLALHIINTVNKKTQKISVLETDRAQFRDFLIQTWRQQCQEKKAQAKGWAQWLSQELNWPLPDGAFWMNEALSQRLAVRLEKWLSLMRMHGGSQSEMLDIASEEQKSRFQKQLRLMAPLLKAWKQYLKQEGAIDFSGLIHQAIALIEKGKFTSPWKHILVDEFQDISPLRLQLLRTLCQQEPQTKIFAVGDDWQAIYRFNGAQLALTTRFEETFGSGVYCYLDTTYRSAQKITEIATDFIQQNPEQLIKPVQSVRKGEKHPVVLLPEIQLETLLDKISAFADKRESVLILSRYHYLVPECLQHAKTRWPGLHIDFMTIHASKGKQADYVIVLGINQGEDGFPSQTGESVLEQVLLGQQETYPDAEERRLLYVALTRAKNRVWLMYCPETPSDFVAQLKASGAIVKKKP